MTVATAEQGSSLTLRQTVKQGIRRAKSCSLDYKDCSVLQHLI
eukprot:COSAG02_NODE_384_length_23406_cov_9.459733_21_plen_43_part_00